MIYLDNHATTKCDLKVVEEMLPFFTENYGNASSGHFFGRIAAQAIDKTLASISNLICSLPEEIIFTSGATESINLILLGLTGGKPETKRNKIITIKTEHKAVLEPLKHLSKNGWEIVYLPLNVNGRVDIEQSLHLIDQETFLVTVQLANSEIGTIQPIKSIASQAKQVGAFFHSDVSQAVGRVPIDVDDMDIDFMSFSSHKIYGPKGVGVLWIRRGLKDLIKPIIFGGGELGHVRPGTPAVPLIVGLGAACKLMSENFANENQQISHLRDTFETLLKGGINNLIINGELKSRLSNNSNISFPNVDAEMLIANLPELVLSTGSACESGSLEPSRVLTSIGISKHQALSTIRFGFGRFNTLNEIKVASSLIIKTYRELLSNFPLVE